jgi:hypothetical protein
MNNEQSKDLDKKEDLKLDSYKERELQLKEREINLKELEINTQLEMNRKNTWSTSPLLIVIISVVFGSFGTAFFQGNSSIQLERQKFEFSLIIKALEGKDKNLVVDLDNRETTKKLLLLIELGLIKTLDSNVIKKLAKNPNDLPDFNTQSKQASGAFSCKIIDGFPNTVVNHPDRGQVLFIKWRGTNYPNNLTANEYCNVVSRRFQKSKESGSLMFITSETKNGENKICSSKMENNICEVELFKVPSSIDAKSIIRGIYEINRGSKQPLLQ